MLHGKHKLCYIITKMNDNLTEKRKTGNLGEDLACRYLEKHGHKIIERNYLKKCGEIDIITIKSNIIHFIEVKSVSCEIDINKTSDYRPEDNVHEWKLKRLSKTIQLYILEKNVSHETNWIFDVITVYIDKEKLVSKIHTLENVVL